MTVPAAFAPYVRSLTPEHPRGANVLCLHGMFAGSWAFESFLPLLVARGYPAHALSYRGHPPNPMLHDIGKVSIADYASDAATVARALDRPILVGHSLGGLVALLVAQQGLARAAVLLTPAPPRGITVFTMELFRRTLKQWPALLFSRALVPAAADIDALVLNRVPATERAAIFERFTADSGRAARQAALGVYAVPPNSVKCPLFVMAGSEDKFIPAHVAAKVARRFNAPLRIAPGHGHYFLGERGWDAEFEAVLDWMDALHV